jgi:hypothetical protein
MSSAEPTKAYVYQAVGLLDAQRKGLDASRLCAVGMPQAWSKSQASITGLTREQATVIADALNLLHGGDEA